VTVSPSALYSSAVAALSDPAGVDWSTATIKCALVTSTYTFSAAHDFFDDVTNELSHASYTAGGATLASKTEVASGGVRTYDAADPAFAALEAAAGTPAAAIIYVDTGTASTSTLLAYIRLPGTAPDGGTYTVVLPSDGIVRLSTSALRWVDVGPMLASHADSADYDPNSVFSSLFVSGNDITVGIDNSVSVDGTSEGAVIVCGDPVELVPGWVTDGTVKLSVEITVSSAPTASKSYWIGVGLTAQTTTYTGFAACVERHTTTYRAAAMGNTSQTVGSASAASAVSRTIGDIYLEGNGARLLGVFCSLRGVTGGNTVSASTSSNTLITSGQLRLCIVAGCKSATNDGPHSATVRIRVAAVPVVPA
jgi:hypothetical protein